MSRETVECQKELCGNLRLRRRPGRVPVSETLRFPFALSAVQLRFDMGAERVRSCASDEAGNRESGEEHPMTVEHNRRYGVANAAGEGLHATSMPPLATLGGKPLLSNRGTPLNLDWVKQVRVNTSAVERRAQSHVLRRTVKKEWQVAWLLRAITCMDLTTLSGDDTDERVRRLCAKARQPLQQELVKHFEIEDLKIQVAAVCVYHRFVETARRALEGSGVRVAAVSTGFPAGLSPLSERIEEIRRSVEAGAQDIDVVITRAHVFGGRWQELYDEIASFKQACGPAHMKVILGTGDLLTLRNVGACEPGRHDGGSGLHQDVYRQGTDECDLAGWLRHDARHPRIRSGDRDGGWL